MKHKSWPVHIWFLDEDLVMSAQHMTDKALLKSTDGCVGAIVSTIMHFIGIRSKKFYDYFFSKENAADTMDRFFANWPLKKKKPQFLAYGWKESKWCRSCHENLDYCIECLKALVDEVAYRGMHHDGALFLSWLESDMPSIDFPYSSINEIVLPWKVLQPKFRRLDIVEGYRLQFIDSFEDGDMLKAYGNCCRDIPKFVLDYFNAS